MKQMFKKIATIAMGALMVGSSVGMAAAAAYPAPFVQGGAANVAVVYGANAALSDVVGAANIQTNLATALAAQTATGGSTTSVSGTAWQVDTGSDKLEIGESIKNVKSYIDGSNLEILKDASIVNSKGTAKYSQYLYFDDLASSMVNYTKNSDDVIGDYFLVANGKEIARYDLQFSTNLKSDITSGTLDDVENEEISLLGKSYTITTATNGSSGVQLTLMSGANKATVNSGEEVTAGTYTISAVVSGTNSVAFTVNGQQVPSGGSKMGKGDIEPIPGTSDYIAVTNIDYESFSGGLHRATFWIGADKIELNNGSTLKVNANSISGTDVRILHTESGGDIAVSEIWVNMTADDDYYVPANGKLSSVITAAKDEPGVLITKNWDIEFKGFKSEETENITLKPTGSDLRYELTFLDGDGSEVTLPLLYTNNSGTFGGYDSDKYFSLAPQHDNLTRNDYFVLSTASPIAASNNAKSYVVQYKGSDQISVDSPILKLRVLGESTDRELSMKKTGLTAGTTISTLQLGGTSFTFTNTSSCETSNCNIALTTSDYAGGLLTGNGTVHGYIRTKYNTLINITDTNFTQTTQNMPSVGCDSCGATTPSNAVWNLSISLDDTNRDDDAYPLSTVQPLITVKFANGTSSDVIATVNKPSSALWINDPSDNTISTYRSPFGALVKETSPSGSPATEAITVPKNFLNPLVYVSSGEIQVSTGSASATELGSVTISDAEIASAAGKNLIVVGGSCINSVAAELLGGAKCSADFTAATTINAGEAIIKSFDRSGKVALLVAGYNAADTTKAITYLTNTAVDTTVGKAMKVTSATEATAIAAAAA